MLHAQCQSDKKIKFISPYGQWHVLAKNFGLISDKFKLLFAPLAVIPLPSNISYQAAEIIRIYTRHPNSSTLNFEDPKACLNTNEEKLTSILDVFKAKAKNEDWNKVFDIVKVISDVYEFSSRWGIKRPLREAAQYSFENFSPEEIINMISNLSTERSLEQNKTNIPKEKNSKSSKSKTELKEPYNANYVGYNYGGIVDTTELDSIVAHHIDQYIHLLNRLPFFKINQILCKVYNLQKNDKLCKKHKKSDDISNLAISINDLLFDFIVNDLENVDFSTKEALVSQFVNINECTPQKLQKFYIVNNEGRNINLTGYSLKKLVEADEELFAVKEELTETKAKCETATKESSEYLNGLHSLFEGKHGQPELTYLQAIREKKVTPSNVSEKVEELINAAATEKLPESLFEKAKNLETTDIKQSLSIYQELTTNFNEKSDQLVSDHVIELAKLRQRNLANSILKNFVKTNRPKMLLTAYKVSLIDYKIVSTVTGERCLKRATHLGDKEAYEFYSDYLLKKDPVQCLKFCLDHSEQDASLLFNVGSILLLGCKAPTVEASSTIETNEVEIEEVKIEPLASPITIPESPYLPSPRGGGGKPFDEKVQTSEGEMFNLISATKGSRNKKEEEEKDKSIEASPWKAIKYFERAASKGFNVANLVLSVISNTDRKRKDYYEKFIINSSGDQNKEDDSKGKRIFPRTKFVIRVVLVLFDLIVDQFPEIESEMLALVNNLIIQDRDASTAEFLFARSTSSNVIDALTRKSPKLPDFLQKEVDQLHENAMNQPPAVRSTVHKIREQEFKERTNIGESLRFPQWLESIGDRSFFKCSGLKGIQFDYEVHKSKKNSSTTPTSQQIKQYFLKLIDKFAFYGCSQLQAIFFNKLLDETNGDSSIGVRSLSIGDSAFSNCSNLCYVELPENLVKIEERLFYSCEKLITVNIPQRTEEIGESAFEGCKSLEFVALHNGIKRIREACFQFCDNLKIIIIPKSVKTISSRSFRLCCGATTLIIQDGVSVIETEAFSGCKQLGFVCFPRKSLKKIYSHAFAKCPSLKAVKIPKDCIVEAGAFDDGVEISFFDDEIFEENDSDIIRKKAKRKAKQSAASNSSKESEGFAFENSNE